MSRAARRRVEERRSTIRALRGLRALLEQFTATTDLDAAAVVVVRALRAALPLEDCWFEATPTGARLPEIDSDGDVNAPVQRRGSRGLALPGAVALPAGDHGRFVLLGDPALGLTVEERLVASAMAAALALAASRRPSRGR